MSGSNWLTAQTRTHLVIYLVGILLSFLIGISISAFTGLDRLGIGLSLVFPTLITLFGVYATNGGMRDALAAAFAVAYFAFLFTVTTIDLKVESQLAKTLVDNFTSLFGVVVGFFFASKTADAVATAVRRPTAGDSRGTPSPMPASTTVAETP